MNKLFTYLIIFVIILGSCSKKKKYTDKEIFLQVFQELHKKALIGVAKDIEYVANDTKYRYEDEKEILQGRQKTDTIKSNKKVYQYLLDNFKNKSFEIDGLMRVQDTLIEIDSRVFQKKQHGKFFCSSFYHKNENEVIFYSSFVSNSKGSGGVFVVNLYPKPHVVEFVRMWGAFDPGVYKSYGEDISKEVKF